MAQHQRPAGDAGGIRSIGILGAGRLGQAFASRAVAAGLRVILSNSRGPASLADAVARLGPLAEAGTVEQAAAADLVLVSIYWPALADALRPLDLRGRIVIDANNPALLPDFRQAELGGRTSTEVFMDWAPGARVVKAFNTLPTGVLESDPAQGGGRRVAFLSGDDADAKTVVAQLAERLGFAPVDLGSLKQGAVQQFPGGPLAGLNLVRVPA